MIIITSDIKRLAEPNFKDFTICDDGKNNIRIMDAYIAYFHACNIIEDRWVEAEEFIKQDPKWWEPHKGIHYDHYN